MTEENKVPMEDIIDQAKEGLDEQEIIGQTENSEHQNSSEEVQAETSEQVKSERPTPSNTHPKSTIPEKIDSIPSSYRIRC